MAYPLSGSASPAMPVWTGKLIPTLWSKKLLERFYDATVFAEISQTDYQGEIRNQGDKVTINKIPDITINAYEAGQPLVYQRPPADTIDLLIDKGFYWAFQMEDVMDVQAAIDMMGPWADNASERLKIAVDTDVLAYMLGKAAAANRGATAGAKSGNINLGVTGTPVALSKTNVLDYIVDLGQVLDEQNIPESGRKLVIPTWMASLIKKSDLKDASITGDGVSVLRNGRLGTIDRFSIYSSNLLPAPAAGESAVYACVPAANTFAAQLTKTEQLRAESTFGDLMRGLMVYGREVVLPNALAQGVVSKA